MRLRRSPGSARRLRPAVLLIPLVLLLLAAGACEIQLPTPSLPALREGGVAFSHDAGFYHEPFQLELGLDEVADQLRSAGQLRAEDQARSSATEITIYYTLDGSEPTPDNIMTDREWREASSETRARTFVYTGPISLGDQLPREPDLATIKTGRMGDEYAWHPPHSSHRSHAVVVRALARGQELQTRTTTRSYFIHPDGDTIHQLPVVSLSLDRAGLFSFETGLYVPGIWAEWWDIYTGNYHQRGRDWERRAHLEYFETEPEQGAITAPPVLSHGVGVRLHGAKSRNFPQKSLRLYARSEYGPNRLAHQFFSTKSDDRFNRLLLRHSGNDWGHTMFRDAAAQTLMLHRDLDIQHYQPAVVYINGEYWGIHNLRDRYDPHYMEQRYGLDPDNITILENNAELDHGSPQLRSQYLDLVAAVGTAPLDTPAAINEKLDLDNWIDYHILQWYHANTDWPYNNVRLWRVNRPPTATAGGQPDPPDPTVNDGRWRWLVYDIDRSFGFTSTKNTNMPRHVLDADDWSRDLVHRLLSIPVVRDEFLQRTAVHLATTFHPERVAQHIQQLAAAIEPEIPRHSQRWRRPGTGFWQQELDIMLDFAANRPRIHRRHLDTWFGEITGTATVEITGVDPDSDIRLHTVRLHPDTPGVEIQDGSWSGELFTGVPLTLESGSTDLSTAVIQGDESAFELLEQTPDRLSLRITGEKVSILL
ncbi:CotH kinase family protein [Spirochaeta africana]|uniref:CotH protein n=1 Tax=Spirochaeta africana (strain ATCC 700263 / DSM 8902 / Z-7692) TaxID=889378 RepID=H9UF37_SPIAZ|nr:CotH kinase family protein [Spirochaeta africana]AFG36130.1 CotH protein [Spirochaeta africana DSM 8902]